MSNMNELDTTLNDLITCVQALADATDSLFRTVNALRETFSGASEPPEEKPAEPVKEYSFTEVRGILAGISGKGHGADVRKLLSKYGATKLSDIRPEDYANLVQDAEAIANG